MKPNKPGAFAPPEQKTRCVAAAGLFQAEERGALTP
jgi:hypothetical protein